MNAARALFFKQSGFLRQLSATISASKPHDACRALHQESVYSNAWKHARTFHGTNSDDTVQARNKPTGIEVEMEDDGKLIFPDGRDALQNPLASLTEEEAKTDEKYWKARKDQEQAPVYVRKVNENGVAYAKGGRKRSHARVWIREGTGRVTVNGHSWVDYFTRIDQRDKILRPMFLLGQTGKFDLQCSVFGGGQTGQAEAIRFCVARALQNWNPDWRPALKKEGLLTRDSRIVEMKKYGKKKARKSFQWVKR